MADKITLFRLLAKQVAKQEGLQSFIFGTAYVFAS